MERDGRRSSLSFMVKSRFGDRSAYEKRQRKAHNYKNLLKNKAQKDGENSFLQRMICNACGKKLAVRQGIVLEGAISIDHTWDYFSEKDGQVDHFDLCEECYDQLTATFKIPVETEEQTEYL